MRLSLRNQILLLLVTAVVVSVGAALAIGSAAVTRDKLAFVYQQSGLQADALAEQVRATLEGSVERLAYLGGALAGYVTAEIINYCVMARGSELGLRGGLPEVVEQMSQQDLASASLRGYDINFMIFAAVYLLAVVCWFMIDSTKPVAPDK